MSMVDTHESGTDSEEPGLSLLDLMIPLAESWRMLVIWPLIVTAAALATTYVMAPTYTARTTFLPPQQQQSSAASALASLSALSGLAGVATKTPADQYGALLRSNTVVDRLIDEFKLIDAYESKFREDARRTLASKVRINIGKKDGLISVDVDDESAERAASLANRHVDELRRLTSSLALTEAQQRRVFFEAELKQTRARLTQAQIELQSSGFNAGALRAEPRAAAEGYARLKAEVTGAEVRLQTLRRALTDTAPEVQQQLTTLSALRGQLAQLESKDDSAVAPGYISKFREFKYQESLFEVFSRQFELARLDESREGTLIQVVDTAQPPERRSSPKRLQVALITALASTLATVLFVFLRQAWRKSSMTPGAGDKISRLKRAFARSPA